MKSCKAGPQRLETQDDRIIRETGVDARVAGIVRPVLEAGGFRLVRVRLTTQNGLTLQIMAEREDGTMSVEDCEEASRLLSPVLDVEDPIDKAYHLEISSPGIDRPLVRVADFEEALGHLVKIETDVAIAGRKRLRGRVLAVGDGAVRIERDTAGEGDVTALAIPLDSIGEARLVLTDDLIRDSLKKDKKARQERKRARRHAADDDGDAATD